MPYAPDLADMPLVWLMGPTATGKTDAAARLCDAVDAQIISVDSSLVYTDMDIGTAKPDAEFLASYPHHLVDIRHPNDTYSVAEFYADCTRLIEQAVEAGKLSVLVGGTMFYFSALEHGLPELPQADPAVRAEISDRAQREGWPVQHARLAELDPLSAERIDPMDAQRIQRALEIVLAEGKPVADYNQKRKPPLRHKLIKIALSYSERLALHERIERRFDIMLEQGLQSEVEQLLQQGVNQQAPSMKMIGYRQMLEFLRGDTTYDEMRNKGIAATRQLAKRQLTWLRNQNNVVWWVDQGLKSKQFGPLVATIQQFIR